jgi:hypothetical protein
MRHGRLKNVEGKFPNLEISEEKKGIFKECRRKNSDFRNQRRKNKECRRKNSDFRNQRRKKGIFKECRKKSKEI